MARILVVDDDPVNLRVLSNHLIPRGYIVHTAESGAEALALVDQGVVSTNMYCSYMLDYFSAHYDTTIGSKKESQSYAHIARDTQINSNRILFVSDIIDELDAAKSAGLQTVLSVRPGNAQVTQTHGHPVINSFAEIEWD